MGVSFYFVWEVSLMEWLQRVLSAPFWTKLATLCSTLGEELVMVGIISFVYWCYDKQWGKKIAIGFLPVLTAGAMVKNIVVRRRPYMDHETIRCLKPVDRSGDVMDIQVQGYSLPSLHAANTAVMYSSLARLVRKTWFWVVAVVIVLAVGFARVFLGVHYPTDVLAGWALGLAVTAAVSCIREKLGNDLLLAVLFGVIGLPGWFYCTSNDFFSAYGLTWGLLVGFYVEEKWVHFENTRSPVRCVLRIVCGVGLFLAIAEGLKLPFSPAFLESGVFWAHFIRAFRYAAASFVAIGIYPLAFRIGAKTKKA